MAPTRAQRGLLCVPIVFAAQRGFRRRTESRFRQIAPQVATAEGTDDSTAATFIATDLSTILARFAARAYLRRAGDRPLAAPISDGMRAALTAAVHCAFGSTPSGDEDEGI